ncbi:hypothetical protein G9A89_023460 [Geosiphon pyriformis]|nr:hypothetical protein G9A89_023460 [Geosiphon pyriformis]
MVLLVLTDRIRKAVFLALESSEFDSSAKERLRNYLKRRTCLPLDLLKEVSKFLVSRDGKLGKEIGLSNYWLHDLLCGSGIYVEPKEEKPRNPELIARLEEILAEQANKEYSRMIARVSSSYDVETFRLLDTEEFAAMRGQLTAIINITFTIVAVFAAVYHVAQSVTGDTGMRILLAGLGGIIVGAAETFLYMRYLSGYGETKRKETSTKKIEAVEKEKRKPPHRRATSICSSNGSREKSDAAVPKVDNNSKASALTSTVRPIIRTNSL